MKMIRLIRFAFIASACMLILCTTHCSKQEKQAVPVGAIIPLTGETAQYGKALQQGMLMASREINEQTELKSKRHISLKFEDSQGSATTGVNAYRKLVDFDKTPIVLGAMFSKVTAAIAPIAEREQVVLLSPTSSDVALTNAGDYIFRIYPSDTYDGVFLAKYIASQPTLNRVAILYLTTSSTTAITRVFENRFKQLGGDVVLVEGHDEQTTDFRTVLGKVNKSNPDAVLLFSYLNQMALILRQAAELNYNFHFVAISTIFDEKIFELASSAANGVMFSTAAYDPRSSDPVVVKFVTEYKAEYGETPNIWAAYGYDVVRIADAAIQEANEVSPQAIKDALYKLSDFPGVTGKTTFDSNGDVEKSLRMMVIRNGQFEHFER